MAASQLAQALGLEKSSVSRMVRKLVEAGELKETADGEDGRVKRLALTAKGRRTLAAIEAFGRQQVTAALDRMQPPQQQAVSRGLALYAQALQAHRQAEPLPAPAQIQVLPGYRPGCIGRIVEMHARFYARHAGFGVFFESRVASGLAEFASRLDKPCNQLWTALDGDRVVGSVAIDGEDLAKHPEDRQAHLRWFILDDGLRGAGTGASCCSRPWRSATSRPSRPPSCGRSAAWMRHAGSTNRQASPWQRNGRASNGARP